MDKVLLTHLYKQILFFTEKGEYSIGNMWFMTLETAKSAGTSKKEVRNLFNKFIDIGFIEKVENEDFDFKIKSMMTEKEIEKLLRCKIPEEVIPGYEPNPEIKAGPTQTRRNARGGNRTNKSIPNRSPRNQRARQRASQLMPVS